MVDNIFDRYAGKFSSVVCIRRYTQNIKTQAYVLFHFLIALYDLFFSEFHSIRSTGTTDFFKFAHQTYGNMSEFPKLRYIIVHTYTINLKM